VGRNAGYRQRLSGKAIGTRKQGKNNLSRSQGKVGSSAIRSRTQSGIEHKRLLDNVLERCIEIRSDARSEMLHLAPHTLKSSFS